jgi:hypothetical protein
MTNAQGDLQVAQLLKLLHKLKSSSVRIAVGPFATFFQRPREKVRRHRPQLWQEQTWLLQHDNAPSHTSVLTQQFLAKNKIAVIPHPPYSPDLTPCDFFLFPKMKLKLKGCRLDNIEIQAEMHSDRKFSTGHVHDSK